MVKCCLRVFSDVLFRERHNYCYGIASNKDSHVKHPMRTVEDFEGVMLSLAEEEGWSFVEAGEEVPLEGVFNGETFGPALLRVAELELAARDLPIELGLGYEAREEALLGVGLTFDPAASLMAAMWRVSMAAYVVDQLPRAGAARDLALLRGVFEQHPVPKA